ncbi:MAG: ATP-dependent metallopeptidase FtsH/Yme1/Tma family protein [Planctomycetaceae bacterium]|nr:ATP-dependent metallopeptidase FtsH/Yme1/Tma family protein [Planctomycetaceae bacterium]
MSNQDPTSSPENNDPSPRKPDKRKPERPSSNLFWIFLIGGTVLMVGYSLFGNRMSGEEVEFSQFRRDIRENVLDASNVHNLVIQPGYITYQDQPVKKSGESSEAEAPTNYYYVPILGVSDETLDDLTDELYDRGINYKYTKPVSELQQAMVFIVITLLFILFLMFLLRRVGGAGSAMSFGRSRGKLFAQEEIEITFKDVAGIEEAVDELKEVVGFLRSPEKYQSLGGRIPRGVLLVGPPGTGKTLLAKAVAGEAGVPFFSLSGSDFVEMFVGVGAARVRDMFQQAAQRSPSIIFIDELDALGKTRGTGLPGGHDEREQTLNALLVEMDGFSSDQSVIVIGATNRPETLDPALMRPGRFDRNVLVDRPDFKGRHAILKVHASKIKMDETVDLERIAKLSPGFVGADLANLVNEAALLAARNDKKRVSMLEFEEGIERVVAGLEKSTRLIHEDEKQRVAYHECGHALVAISLPNTDPVHKISIIPRGLGALGYTLQRPEDDRMLVTRSELVSRINVLLGGIAAEDMIYQESSTGAQNDLQRATDIARRMVTEFGMSMKLGRVHYSDVQRSPFLMNATSGADHAHSEQTAREIDLEVKKIIDECMQEAADILRDRQEILEQMTQELLEVEVMDDKHIKRILDAHKKGPSVMPGTFKDDEDEKPNVSSSDASSKDLTAEDQASREIPPPSADGG